MPILEIEGREVEVDDSFLKLSPADQQSTVEEIAASLGIKQKQAAPVSGMFDQFLAGAESKTEGVGVSMEEVGKEWGSEGLTSAGQGLRNMFSQPDNFVSAGERFWNPQQGDSYVDPVLGMGWGNAAGGLAEGLGSLSGSIAARGAGSLAGGAAGSVIPGVGTTAGAAAGALATPALFEFLATVGPNAKALAEKRQRGSDPTWADWTQAAATSAASGVLDSIGVGKLGKLNEGLKEVGKKTYGTVIKETTKETGKKALKEGTTEAGQSVIQQFGTSAGTPGGAQVDLKQALGEGILGAGAGGMVDAGRNIAPMVSQVNDIKSVDYNTDPYARERAEITRDLNDTANSPTRDGEPLVPGDLTKYVDDLRAQAEEAIKGQKLPKADEKALLRGLRDANGIGEDRLNEIAGRSESPDAIKAMYRKVQLVRSMTVQQQAKKGLRGWAANSLRIAGIPAGIAVETAIGGTTGGYLGGVVGGYVGRDLARSVANSQTQGNRLDKLVGAKQARRAKMLLDRYGPSEATNALNTLTEKAAANKLAEDQKAQEKKDWDETLNRIKRANAARKNAREQWENAPPELKAQKKAEKEATDLKTREERLTGMTIRSAQARVRLETLSNKLETEKSLNSLRVEKAQTERELSTALSQNRATASKAQADGKVLDLQGKLLKIVDDIKIREQVIAKYTAVAKRAEKMAERAPQAQTAAKAAATQAGRRYAKMTSEQMSQVKEDQYGNPIRNEAQYRMSAEYIMKMEAEGLAAAAAYPDKAQGTRFIEAINQFHAFKGRKNQQRRMAIYRDLMSEVDPSDLDAQRFIASYIVPLAYAFEDTGGQSTKDSGFGEDPPF
jgi:hypothetical protein